MGKRKYCNKWSFSVIAVKILQNKNFCPLKAALALNLKVFFLLNCIRMPQITFGVSRKVVFWYNIFRIKSDTSYQGCLTSLLMLKSDIRTVISHVKAIFLTDPTTERTHFQFPRSFPVALFRMKRRAGNHLISTKFFAKKNFFSSAIVLELFDFQFLFT